MLRYRAPALVVLSLSAFTFAAQAQAGKAGMNPQIPRPTPDFLIAWRLDDASVVFPTRIPDEALKPFDDKSLPGPTISSASTKMRRQFKPLPFQTIKPESDATLTEYKPGARWTLWLGGDVRVTATLEKILTAETDNSDCNALPLFAQLRIDVAGLAAYRAAKEKYYLTLPSQSAAGEKSTLLSGRWIPGFKLEPKQEAAMKTAVTTELIASFRKTRLGPDGKLVKDSEFIGESDPRWPKFMAIDRRILAGGGTLMYDLQAFQVSDGKPPLLSIRAKLRLDGYDRILERFWGVQLADGSYELKEQDTWMGDAFYSSPSEDGKLSTEKLGLVLNVFSLDGGGGIGVLIDGYGTEGIYFSLQPFADGRLQKDVSLYYEGC